MGRKEDIEEARLRRGSSTRACTTGAFTPGIASGSELKFESGRLYRGKCVRSSVRKKLSSRMETYSGVERFGAKGKQL